MPKIDLDAIPQTNATGYPPEYATVVKERWYRRLSPATGLTDFGATHCVLQPGAWSAQRHWHELEDEFLVMIDGHATLVDDNGRTPMQPGDCAAFPKKDGNGHCLINETDVPCTFVVIGQEANGACHYPDVDMHQFEDGRKARKDGRGF